MISAQLLESLDQAGIACFIKQADGRYSFINESGAHMLGRRPSDVINRDDFELFSPETAAEMMKRDYSIFTARNVEEYESEASIAGIEDATHFKTVKCGFWQSDKIGGGIIGVSIADEEPSPEQLRLLELMKTILSEAAEEVVAQIELLNNNPVLH